MLLKLFKLMHKFGISISIHNVDVRTGTYTYVHRKEGRKNVEKLIYPWNILCAVYYLCYFKQKPKHIVKYFNVNKQVA